jgi:hypothetical protein
MTATPIPDEHGDDHPGDQDASDEGLDTSEPKPPPPPAAVPTLYRS